MWFPENWRLVPERLWALDVKLIPDEFMLHELRAMDYLSEISFMYINENFFDITLKNGTVEKANMVIPKLYAVNDQTNNN